MKVYSHFIDGVFTNPSGQTIASVDPSTGKVWAAFEKGDAATADQAIQSANRAFATGPWANADAQARAKILDRLAEVLKQSWQSLVSAEIQDNGKRITEVSWQFSGLHTWYRHFAAEAR